MPKDIRPYDETAPASESSDLTSDARTTEFMNALRARINAKDEEQRQSWQKPVKNSSRQKPITPSRPGWLNEPAPKPASEPAKTPKKNPFANTKKRSQRP